MVVNVENVAVSGIFCRQKRHIILNAGCINSDAAKFEVGAPVFFARIGCTVSSKSAFDAEKVSKNSQHALRACNFCPEMSVYRNY